MIVGTQAPRTRPGSGRMALKYPQRLVLGLDARDGQVATEGWLDVSSVEATTLAEQFDDLPLGGVVYTDIACDGMLEGRTWPPPRRSPCAENPGHRVRGVGTLEDLTRSGGLAHRGLHRRARALYDGRFRLREARERAGDSLFDTLGEPQRGSSFSQGWLGRRSQGGRLSPNPTGGRDAMTTTYHIARYPQHCPGWTWGVG